MSTLGDDKPVAMIPAAPAQPQGLRPRPIMVEALREMINLGSDNPKMPESIFIEFLRVLYNPKTQMFDTALWYRTFNSHRLAIDILDPAGVVIYVCPPIMGTITTRTAVPRTESLSRMVGESREMERRHAALGDAVMKEGLKGYQGGDIISVRQAWIQILSRYGMIQTAQVKSPSQLSSDNLLDDVDEI
jgi:hypothetical protein